jgi:transcriptional regulator with XRE-family HTH domain
MGASPSASASAIPRSVAVLLGERITELRDDRDWSTYRLAQESDLSESYLGELQQGKHEPTLTTLLKLTHAFGLCSIEELLTGRAFGTNDFLEAAGL